MSDPAPTEAPPPTPEVIASEAPPPTPEAIASEAPAQSAPEVPKKETPVETPKAKVKPEAVEAKPKEEVGMVLSHLLDTEEWDRTLGKMLRYHFNIGEEIRILIQQIRKEMKEELVPVAEDRANYGKIVKMKIREMWGLEYEICDIQEKFLENLGSIDLNNLTDDFVEEVMLQSKPLQGILMEVRQKQKAAMDSIEKEYNELIKDLEPMKVERPPKPEPKPDPPKEEPTPEAPKEAAPQPSEAPPASETAQTEDTTPPFEAPAEPTPAIEASALPAAVEASA
eukprot:maker-scaffold624_size122968-snap-gene-0.17 protein:Tk09508 transcript:maker-scaffold624_size122968-snap-gene-0.17-mRNA-1 annotation:"GA24356"